MEDIQFSSVSAPSSYDPSVPVSAMQGLVTSKSPQLTEICNLLRHGPHGIHNEASRTTLEHEFGTSNDNEAILKILEQGEIQENFVRKAPLLNARWNSQILRG